VLPNRGRVQLVADGLRHRAERRAAGQVAVHQRALRAGVEENKERPPALSVVPCPPVPSAAPSASPTPDANRRIITCALYHKAIGGFIVKNAVFRREAIVSAGEKQELDKEPDVYGSVWDCSGVAGKDGWCECDPAESGAEQVEARQIDAGFSKRDNTIYLPAVLLKILKWHCDTQMVTDAMRESELLFPAKEGGFRSRSCLDKPFKAVTAACGMKKVITPKAMRRTFKDLARAAKLEAIVGKAISGHQTDAMHLLYQTANENEVSQGIARVISIASRRRRWTAS
jgi:hypothetical protein